MTLPLHHRLRDHLNRIKIRKQQRYTEEHKVTSLAGQSQIRSQHQKEEGVRKQAT